MDELNYQGECIFCGVPLIGTEADRDKPQVCIMCADPRDHFPPERGDAMKPKVLVEVEEGVATCHTVGDVEVLIVDYDVLEMGERISIPEEFYQAFPGLREAIHASCEGKEG
jgi:hypothetical protein